jgi:formyltetrahydrofolate synthetase
MTATGDIEQATGLKPIEEIAEMMGLARDDIEMYGPRRPR